MIGDIRLKPRRGAASSSLAWLSLTSLVAAGATITYLAFAEGQVGFSDGDPLVGYFALAVVLGTVALLGVRFVSANGRQGSLDILEIPIGYTLWILVGIVPFGILAFTDEARYQLNVPMSKGAITAGLWLPVLGLAGVWLGYYLGRVTLSTRRIGLRLLPGEPLKLAVIVYYLLIWVERLWRVRTVGAAYAATTAVDELSGLNQLSNYFEQSAALVLAITSLQVFRQRWSMRYLLWMAGCEGIFALVAGFTAPLVSLVLVLVTARQYAGRPIRFGSSWKWAVVLAFAVFILPVEAEYRTLLQSGQIEARSPTALVDGLVRSAENSWLADPGGASGVLWDKVASREAVVAQTFGLVVELTPSVIPYWGVERLLAIPADVVPRAFWPDKPNLSTGVYFAINYLGAPADTVSSAADTIVGDLYVSAGWAATIVGMLVLGFVAALLYGVLKVIPLEKGNYTLPALYIGLAVSMLDVEGSYIGVMVGLVHRFFVYTMIFWLLHWRGPGSDDNVGSLGTLRG